MLPPPRREALQTPVGQAVVPEQRTAWPMQRKPSRALVITTSLSVLRRHVLKSASMVLISTIGLTIWYRMEPVKGLFARSPAAADRVSEICPLLPAPFVPSLA